MEQYWLSSELVSQLAHLFPALCLKQQVQPGGLLVRVHDKMLFIFANTNIHQFLLQIKQ